MKVSGKEIANRILEDLKVKIQEENLAPHLAIILASKDPASRMYDERKMKAAESIGVRATLFEFNPADQEKCIQKVIKLNNDPNVHGIIIQQPMYSGWDGQKFIKVVSPEKDVDGFLKDSPFFGATAQAVWEMLSEFAKIEGLNSTERLLNGKNIVVLGKGITAGKPTIELLTKKGFPPVIIDSKTKNPNEIIKDADIVISATGRKNIINATNIKKGSFIIGVGVGKEDVGGEKKIYGDVQEEEISGLAKLYSPTIGGIGPLTVACLLRNVVDACEDEAGS